MKKILSLIPALLMLVSVSCSSVKRQLKNTSSIVDSETDSTVEVTGNKEPIETSAVDHSNDVILTMADMSLVGFDDPLIDSLIKRFNADDNGYTIVLRDYAEYIGEGTENNPHAGYVLADEKLAEDLENGDIDIISINSFANESNYGVFSARGLFADLYDFMENDTNFSKDSLNSHIFELVENDGKLDMMPTSFSIHTLIGAEKYAESKENWKFDELIANYSNAPDGAAFSGSNSRDLVAECILGVNVTSFIDRQNKTVSFDSLEFRQMLEFCNSFYPDMNYSELEEADTDYLINVVFSNFNGYHSTVADFEEKYGKGVFVGFPSETESGGIIQVGVQFSICKNSDKAVQQGAWEFFKYLIDDEVQSEMYDSSNSVGFPVNEKIFGEKADEALDREEYQRLVEYINSVDRNISLLDFDIGLICSEETNLFFRSIQTEDETISNLQRRATKLINEYSENIRHDYDNYY